MRAGVLAGLLAGSQTPKVEPKAPPALGVLELDVEESLGGIRPEEPPSKRIRGIRAGGGSDAAPSEGPFTLADSFQSHGLSNSF